MKKIISAMLILLTGVFALTSCRKNNSSSDPISYGSDDKEIYINYLNTVTFGSDINATAAAEAKTNNQSYYEVYLPTDTSTKYLSVSSASEYDSKYDSIYANYASTYSKSNDEYNDIINIIKSDAAVGATLNIFDEVSTKIETPQNYFDTQKDSRVFAVVYVPVKVVYAYYKKSTLKTTTTSYVLAPVYASLTTKTNDVIADSNVAGINEIIFTVNKGAIQ